MILTPPAPTTRVVTFTRHRNVREHQTWAATVPEAMLADPTYFDESNDPTPAFDQWICDNGDLLNQEHDETDDGEYLYYEVEAIE